MAQQVIIDIVASTEKLTSGVNQTNSELGKLSGGISKAQQAAVGLASAFVLREGVSFLKKANDEAIDAEKTAKLAAIAFGEGSDALKKITSDADNFSKSLAVDNDDLINKKAIRKCIYEFSLDKDLTLVNGSISGFNSFESKNYLSDFKENKCGHMNNKTSLELIESYLKNYRIIWFSIYKTEIFQDVWKHCFKFSCKNILNNEIFHGLLSCSYGKFKFLNEVTYIRRTNPINSVYRSLTIKKKIMFKGEQNRMIKYICNIFKYNKKKMLLLYNARRSMPDKRNVLSRLILFIVRKKSFTLINLVKLNNFLTFIK